ncbi:MAG: 1,4-alpha-glucan branching enzyme, partial [Pseudomonadales bacterium]
MSNPAASSLSQQQVNALLAAQYEDIFAVLGMHQPSPNGSIVVRALLPGASAVDVIDCANDQKVASLAMVDAAGLFEGKAGRRRKRFAYRLQVQYPNNTVQLHDPYRFGSQLQDEDLYLFCEGTQEQVYRWMGAHPRTVEGVEGMLFAVWAPNAKRVSVVGEFNQWDGRRHMMRKHPGAGIWEIFIPQLDAGLNYKYEIISGNGQL